MCADRTGLIIIYTGDGKGKTTAALGTALRALGHGRRVLVVQFIKGTWKSGEQQSAKNFSPKMEIRTAGAGFVYSEDTLPEEHRLAAENGLEMVREALLSNSWDMIILDEIFATVTSGLLSEEQVIEALEYRNRDIDVVMTGRNAPSRILEVADTISDFSETKHPFSNGIEARRGIEY